MKSHKIPPPPKKMRSLMETLFPVKLTLFSFFFSNVSIASEKVQKKMSSSNFFIFVTYRVFLNYLSTLLSWWIVGQAIISVKSSLPARLENNMTDTLLQRYAIIVENSVHRKIFRLTNNYSLINFTLVRAASLWS